MRVRLYHGEFCHIISVRTVRLSGDVNGFRPFASHLRPNVQRFSTPVSQHLIINLLFLFGGDNVDQSPIKRFVEHLDVRGRSVSSLLSDVALKERVRDVVELKAKRVEPTGATFIFVADEFRRNEFIASKCVEYDSRARTKHIASRRERPGRVARVARIPHERASARRHASCDSGRDSVARDVADARRERGAIDPSQHDAPNRAYLRPPRRRSRARRAQNSGTGLKTRERSFPASNSRRDFWSSLNPR